MKKCMYWCLSIIELKNARWNIERYHLFNIKSRSVKLSDKDFIIFGEKVVELH